MAQSHCVGCGTPIADVQVFRTGGYCTICHNRRQMEKKAKKAEKEARIKARREAKGKKWWQM